MAYNMKSSPAKIIGKIFKKKVKKKVKKAVQKSVKTNPSKTSSGRYATMTDEVTNIPKVRDAYNEEFIKRMSEYFKK
jgi:hypothetical protein